jgi:hypothetical protein
VDGKSTPVLQADGAFLGVVMQAGPHKIRMDYHRPLAADIGRLITFGMLLGLAVAGWRGRRRGQDREQARDRERVRGRRRPPVPEPGGRPGTQDDLDWERAVGAPSRAAPTTEPVPTRPPPPGGGDAARPPTRRPARPAPPPPPSDPPRPGPD